MESYILHISNHLRKIYAEADWWELLEKPVKDGILHVLDNLWNLGIPFKTAFLGCFTWDHAIRYVSKKSVPLEQPSPLFGKAMPEEWYHCGKRAVIWLFNLDPWYDPNDAEVHACQVLCQHLEVIEECGLFGDSVLNVPLSQILTTLTVSTPK